MVLDLLNSCKATDSSRASHLFFRFLHRHNLECFCAASHQQTQDKSKLYYLSYLDYYSFWILLRRRLIFIPTFSDKPSYSRHLVERFNSTKNCALDTSRSIKVYSLVCLFRIYSSSGDRWSAAVCVRAFSDYIGRFIAHSGPGQLDYTQSRLSNRGLSLANIEIYLVLRHFRHLTRQNDHYQKAFREKVVVYYQFPRHLYEALKMQTI